MKLLLGKEAYDLVSKTLDIVSNEIVQDIEEAKKQAEKFSYPVVLKLISEKALHKTEIGAVKIIHDAAELEKAFSELEKIDKENKLKADFLMQEFIEGNEIILGLKHDETFGHVIMLGVGGIFVELLKDVSFRACPITEEDADSMIQDLKVHELLLGYRGKKTNIKLLKEILVNLSKLPEKLEKSKNGSKNGSKNRIKELDINPLIINGKIAKAVDVRVVLE